MIDQRAIEEWKQLQTIIGRLEGLEYQIRGWLLILLGALMAAFFSDKSKITPLIFLIVGLLVVSIFCFMELAMRTPKRRSIRRARIVEQALREEIEYDGPKIVAFLSDHRGTPVPEKIKTLWSEFLSASILGFYGPLWGVVIIVRIAI